MEIRKGDVLRVRSGKFSMPARVISVMDTIPTVRVLDPDTLLSVPIPNRSYWPAATMPGFTFRVFDVEAVVLGHWVDNRATDLAQLLSLVVPGREHNPRAELIAGDVFGEVRFALEEGHAGLGVRDLLRLLKAARTAALAEVSQPENVIEHGLGTGYPRVAGTCPACHLHSLFLAEGGHVTCATADCKNPAASDDLLHASNLTEDEFATLKAHLQKIVSLPGASQAMPRGIYQRALTVLGSRTIEEARSALSRTDEFEPVEIATPPKVGRSPLTAREVDEAYNRTIEEARSTLPRTVEANRSLRAVYDDHFRAGEHG